jgi:hypothetical protein
MGLTRRVTFYPPVIVTVTHGSVAATPGQCLIVEGQFVQDSQRSFDPDVVQLNACIAFSTWPQNAMPCASSCPSTYGSMAYSSGLVGYSDACPLRATFTGNLFSRHNDEFWYSVGLLVLGIVLLQSIDSAQMAGSTLDCSSIRITRAIKRSILVGDASQDRRGLAQQVVSCCTSLIVLEEQRLNAEMPYRSDRKHLNSDRYKPKSLNARADFPGDDFSPAGFPYIMSAHLLPPRKPSPPSCFHCWQRELLVI